MNQDPNINEEMNQNVDQGNSASLDELLNGIPTPETAPAEPTPQEQPSSTQPAPKKPNFIPIIAIGVALAILLIFIVSVFSGSNSEERAELFSDGLLAVQTGDTEWSYLNEKGEVEFKLKKVIEAFAFQNGYALVQDDEGKFGYIDKKGEYVIKPEYDVAYAFADNGLALVGETSVEETLENLLDGVAYEYKYIDKDGDVVIDGDDFDRAYSFEEELDIARVMVDGEWGLINKKGDFVLDPKYSYISSFDEEGYACVGNEDDEYGLINAKGKEVVDLKYDDLYSVGDGYYSIADGDECGVINAKGKVLIKPEYDDIMYMGEDLFAVLVEDDDGEYEYGVVNSKGKEVIEIGEFDGFYGVIDDYGYILVLEGEECGWVKKNGKFVIDADFDYARPFSDGLAAVRDDGEWGYINKKGDVVIKCKYGSANNFYDGYAVVSNTSGSYGMIDDKGEVVLKLKYTSVSSMYADGFIIVNDGGEYMIMDDSFEQAGSVEFRNYNLSVD